MIYIDILIMALVTYLIRMIPLAVFHKKIENRFARSFLYYVPYSCLTAMTIPAVFSATGHLASAAAGVAAAVLLAFRGRGLVTVAAGSCGVVFIVEQFFL